MSLTLPDEADNVVDGTSLEDNSGSVALDAKLQGGKKYSIIYEFFQKGVVVSDESDSEAGQIDCKEPFVTQELMI